MAARETWVDVAKGIAIILVVLFHAIIFPIEVGLGRLWGTFAALLDTFRMPLFFFTAGLFAAKAISLPFGQLFRTRVARLLWLFVLWSTIWFVVFLFAPPLGDGGIGSTPLEFALLLIWPNVSTWFVYGLALFFMASWLMRGLPVWLQLAIGVVIAQLFDTDLIDSPNGAHDKMGMYFVYFLLATHVGPRVRGLAPRVRWWHALIATAVYGVAIVITARAELLQVPFVRMAVALLAIVAGCSVAIALSRWRAFGWLRELGSRTLQVYLVHFYPILAICLLIAPVAPSLQGVGVLLPPVLTVVAILTALGVHRLTRRVSWLWDLPIPLRPKPRSARAESGAETAA